MNLANTQHIWQQTTAFKWNTTWHSNEK